MEKTAAMRAALQCTVHPIATLDHPKYVVVCSRYHNQWLMSRHKKRATWETQGGHIEAGETPLQAAARELYEESGITDASLYPVCDYHGFDDRSGADGVVFLADVRTLGRLPESEMEETCLFEELPAALTYPAVTPRLMHEALELYRMLHPEEF